jgi:hypothetical protein
VLPSEFIAHEICRILITSLKIKGYFIILNSYKVPVEGVTKLKLGDQGTKTWGMNSGVAIFPEP